MASAASRARGSMRERSLLIWVKPTPATFTERRSILQVLEQHGPMEYFRLRAGSYDNFVAVTKDAATAERLVGRSPFTYAIPMPRPIAFSSLPSADRIKDAVDGAVPTSSPTGKASDNPSEPEHPTHEQRSFQLRIFPAPEYNHTAAAASSSALHGTWPASYKEDRSFVAATLKQSLPNSLAANGLAHWLLDFGEVPRGSKMSRLRMKSWRPGYMKDGGRGARSDGAE